VTARDLKSHELLKALEIRLLPHPVEKEGWAKKKAERGERGNEKASLAHHHP